MLKFFVIIFIGSVYLSSIGAQLQNSRNADSMLQNTYSSQPPHYQQQRQDYRDSYNEDVINIGNGNHRRNFVVINENPRQPTDGTSRNTGNTQQNVGGTRTDQMVNFNNRFGGENIPPVTNSNRRPVYTNFRRGTIVNNIGNGAGNSNWVVIEDTPNDGQAVFTVPNNNFQNRNTYPYNNEETTFSRQPVDSNVPNTRIYTRIGHGPNNYNRVTVNGQTIYDTDLENRKRQGEQFSNNYIPNNSPSNNTETTFRRQLVNSNIPYTRLYNRIGNGPNNYNIVSFNRKTVYDTDLENQTRQGEQFSNYDLNNNNNNLEDDKLKVLPRYIN